MIGGDCFMWLVASFLVGGITVSFGVLIAIGLFGGGR